MKVLGKNVLRAEFDKFEWHLEGENLEHNSRGGTYHRSLVAMAVLKFLLHECMWEAAGGF